MPNRLDKLQSKLEKKLPDAASFVDVDPASPENIYRLYRRAHFVYHTPFFERGRWNLWLGTEEGTAVPCGQLDIGRFGLRYIAAVLTLRNESIVLASERGCGTWRLAELELATVSHPTSLARILFGSTQIQLPGGQRIAVLPCLRPTFRNWKFDSFGRFRFDDGYHMPYVTQTRKGVGSMKGAAAGLGSALSSGSSDIPCVIPIPPGMSPLFVDEQRRLLQMSRGDRLAILGTAMSMAMFSCR